MDLLLSWLIGGSLGMATFYSVVCGCVRRGQLGNRRGNFESSDMCHHVQIARGSWYPIGPQWHAKTHNDRQRPAGTRKDTSWHGMSQNDISHRPYFLAKCAQ